MNKLDPSGAISCDPGDDEGCSADPDDWDDDADDVGGGDCVVLDSGMVSCPTTSTVVSSTPLPAPPDLVDQIRDFLGVTAPPMSSSEPDPYSPSDEYSNVTAQCMFANGGNGEWGNLVRGCLAAMYTTTPPGVPYSHYSSHDHFFCYANASLTVGGVKTVIGLGTAVAGAAACTLTQTPVPVALPSGSITVIGPLPVLNRTRVERPRRKSRHLN